MRRRIRTRSGWAIRPMTILGPGVKMILTKCRGLGIGGQMGRTGEGDPRKTTSGRIFLIKLKSCATNMPASTKTSRVYMQRFSCGSSSGNSSMTLMSPWRVKR